jgi:hypothetical protein
MVNSTSEQKDRDGASAAIEASSPAASSPPQIPRPTSPSSQSGYYSGLVTSDLRQDNGSSSADMLKRNLQLAGGVTGVLALLVLGFLSSNGLV